jgi:hypothetical protein
MRRVGGAVLIGLAVFGLVLAVLMPTVVTTGSKKTPLNLDVTIVSSGPGKVFDSSTGQIKDVTLRATRIVRTDTAASDSKNTTVDETLCVIIDQDNPSNCLASTDPRLLSITTDRVTSDRVTAEAVHVDGWGENVNGDTSVRHTGLSYKWPIDSKKQTYQFFEPDLKAAFPAQYLRTEKLEGLTVYVYECDINAQPYKIQGLIDGTYTDTRTVWVEPQTGAIVKGVEHQVQVFNSGQVALDTTLTFNPPDVAAQAKTAKDKIKQLQVAQIWAPLILAVLGLAALIGGLFLLRSANAAGGSDGSGGGGGGGGGGPGDDGPPDFVPGYEGEPAPAGSSQT